MKFKALSISFLVALLAAGVNARAEDSDRDMNLLLQELNALIDRGERNRSAEDKFLRQLRALADRYDRRGGGQVLHDDFEDGNYTRSPEWRVVEGRFWVQSGALYSRATPDAREDSRESADAAELFGAVLERAMKKDDQKSSRTDNAHISTEADIPNAFTLEMELSADKMDGHDIKRHFQIGPFQRHTAAYGYRLTYTAPHGDQRGALEIVLVTKDGAKVVEAYRDLGDLADGRKHKLTWSRDDNGEMRVSLDDRQVLSTRDRSFRNDYNGLFFLNLGGEYALDSITVSANR